jgi:DNA mismatch endonuclease (patch repair protein)
MRAQRVRDTAPELAVRRLLHARGLRYRVDHRVIPGTNRRVDIAFTRARVAVLIDGCFWHGCPEHFPRPPSVNEWYWPAKIARNKARDDDTDARLAADGWLVIRVWEHEDPTEVADRIATAVHGRRQA